MTLCEVVQNMRGSSEYGNFPLALYRKRVRSVEILAEKDATYEWLDSEKGKMELQKYKGKCILAQNKKLYIGNTWDEAFEMWEKDPESTRVSYPIVIGNGDSTTTL